MAKDGKTHMSIVVCGHVDAGKSTTTGRLIFELGGIEEREMAKLRAEAEALNKGSFAFAFYMDRQKEERARGVTIACTTKEFFTDSYHYTVIDAPGHRDFIKNMITGASQADVALLMVPADGNFTASIQKGNHKQGIVQGQTRQHARLINLLGVKQLVVGVNKMDCDMAGYKKARYDEVADEVKNCLTKVGWKKVFVNKRVPVLPISGWMGDNLLKQSENMPWWKGQEIVIGNKAEGNLEKLKVITLLDCLEKMVKEPKRVVNKPLRVPVSGVYKIKGAGDVITGRVEQGVLKPKDDVKFVGTHDGGNPCTGTIFKVEMHHSEVAVANPGDNVGMNVKGLNKQNMPRVGDVMILRNDDGLKKCKSFTAQVQILQPPGPLKVGYAPIAFVRTGRCAAKIVEIIWKMGKKTGNQKVDNPKFIERNEVACIKFEPQQPFVCDAFKSSEGLGRVAILEGASVQMLGKITAVEFKEF